MSSSAATTARRSCSTTAILRATSDWLAEAAAAYGRAIHAYVLMTNHVHLLVTPESPRRRPAGDYQTRTGPTSTWTKSSCQ